MWVGNSGVCIALSSPLEPMLPMHFKIEPSAFKANFPRNYVFHVAYMPFVHKLIFFAFYFQIVI